MTNFAHIADRYIELWNEGDEARRQTMLNEGWSEAATYVDPVMSGQGHAQISTLVRAVHNRFPGFRFCLDGRVDGYGDKVRFSWTFGPEAEPEMIKGTDFAVVENGRLTSVTGFLDKVPTAA